MKNGVLAEKRVGGLEELVGQAGRLKIWRIQRI